MKEWVKGLLYIIVAVAVVIPLLASEISSPKIAFVNIAKATKEYKKMKEINESYQRDMKFYQEKLAELEKEIKELQAKGAPREEIIKKQQEYLQKKQLFESMLKQEYEPKLQQVFNEVVQKAQEFAKKKGIDILLGQGVVYAKDEYDLTDEFIEYLNSGK